MTDLVKAFQGQAPAMLFAHRGKPGTLNIARFYDPTHKVALVLNAFDPKSCFSPLGGGKLKAVRSAEAADGKHETFALDVEKARAELVTIATCPDKDCGLIWTANAMTAERLATVKDEKVKLVCACCETPLTIAISADELAPKLETDRQFVEHMQAQAETDSDVGDEGAEDPALSDFDLGDLEGKDSDTSGLDSKADADTDDKDKDSDSSDDDTPVVDHKEQSGAKDDAALAAKSDDDDAPELEELDLGDLEGADDDITGLEALEGPDDSDSDAAATAATAAAAAPADGGDQKKDADMSKTGAQATADKDDDKTKVPPAATADVDAKDKIGSDADQSGDALDGKDAAACDDPASTRAALEPLKHDSLAGVTLDPQHILLARLADNGVYTAHIFHKGMPCGLLSSAAAADDMKDLFADTMKLTDAFKAAVASEGLSEDVRKRFGVAPYLTTIAATDAIDQRAAKAVADERKRADASIAHVSENVKKVAVLAIQQVIKGINGSKNPVRKPLLARLAAMRVVSPGQIIDREFAAAADELSLEISKALDGLLAKDSAALAEASKWISTAAFTVTEDDARAPDLSDINTRLEHGASVVLDQPVDHTGGRYATTAGDDPDAYAQEVAALLPGGGR